MPGAIETTRALLLRSVDYRESDRVVTLLTERFGKRSALARAARASKRRFGGALQPLCVLEVQLQRGRGELETLVTAQIKQPFTRTLGDLARMSAGFAGIELLRELTGEHEADPGLFALAVSFLVALDAGDCAPEPLGVCFAAALLAELGHAPRLDRCGGCGKQPSSAQTACFDPVQGTIVCRACGGASYRLPARVRERLGRAAAGDFSSAAAGEWSRLEELRARRAIDAFVEARLGKALRAPSLAAPASPRRSASGSHPRAVHEEP
ncbi:MAG TPA: DNA repair protein RecO [Polyangiales bacterium]|nr:DNA repair protein RecO [Polyangiales bacterium]